MCRLRGESRHAGLESSQHLDATSKQVPALGPEGSPIRAEVAGRIRCRRRRRTGAKAKGSRGLRSRDDTTRCGSVRPGFGHRNGAAASRTVLLISLGSTSPGVVPSSSSSSTSFRTRLVIRRATVSVSAATSSALGAGSGTNSSSSRPGTGTKRPSGKQLIPEVGRRLRHPPGQAAEQPSPPSARRSSRKVSWCSRTTVWRTVDSGRRGR